MSERRQFDRLACDFDVKITAKNSLDFKYGRAKNISKIGMGIEIPDHFDNIDEQYVIVQAGSISLIANVARQDRTEMGTYFLGLWFDSISDDDFDRIINEFRL